MPILNAMLLSDVLPGRHRLATRPTATSCFSARPTRTSRSSRRLLATLPTKARGQVFIEVD